MTPFQLPPPADHARQLFAEAWSSRVPADTIHPGPRQNHWDRGERVAPRPLAEVPIAAILHELWRPRGFHPDSLTREPTGTARRAIPSAGGCYPVQVHLVAGDGCDLSPGTFALDPQDATLVRRAGMVQPGRTPRGALVVLGVLPQRTRGKYHHRTPPLLIADTAYALSGIIHRAAAYGLECERISAAPGELARVLGLPTYARWQEVWPGTGPELLLTALWIGHPNRRARAAAERLGRADASVILEEMAAETGRPRADAGPRPLPERESHTDPETVAWVDTLDRDFLGSVSAPSPVHPLASDALARRRSLPLHAPEAPDAAQVATERVLTALASIQPPPDCRIEVIGTDGLADPSLAASCAGQHWIRSLHGLVRFHTDRSPTPATVWWASTSAATILYSCLGAGLPLGFRPIGSWHAHPGTPLTLHGLGFRSEQSKGAHGAH
ncbi:hypothetical protein M2390_001079 [Mycetocola sp. BIGb0189]|uniref:hypothetical protein n=1 Tax=Mycetocola sp. BIGb0189 TaxID=2940604 RepID=UPI0021690CF1|nr:hypothetical protein [Mycetocola sp. BIGb0189]MCS4275907.1 hypothetical protein [Mycetocola sp. BIGb0189]